MFESGHQLRSRRCSHSVGSTPKSFAQIVRDRPDLMNIDKQVHFVRVAKVMGTER
jgi:hypothetical protein